MPDWGNYSYAFGPLIALVAVGALALLLRWTFSRGTSLVERRSRPGSPSDYGLLEVVASPPTFIEAEMMRQRLVEHHIRATLAPTTQGPRVLVWPDDVSIARAVLDTTPPER